MKWESTDWAKGPGRVIDRRGQKAKQDYSGLKTVLLYSAAVAKRNSGGQRPPTTAHKLGLSAYSAQSLRSMGPRLGQTMPRSYKIPDRKSTRSLINNFTKGR